MNSEVKKKSAGLWIVIIGILFVIGVGIAIYFLYFKQNPYKYYQQAVEAGINEMFSYVHNDDVFEYEIATSFVVDDKENNLPSNIVELINSINVNSTIQFDRVNQKMVFKLNSTMKNEALLNGELYSDINSNKAYIYVPDYYSKYV